MTYEPGPVDMLGVPITVGCELIWVKSQGGYLRQGRVTRIEPNRAYGWESNEWTIWLQDPQKEGESKTHADGPRAFVVRSGDSE